MGLITIDGTNPFEGQADPYIGVSSNINYDGTIDTLTEGFASDYTLNGVITGCSLGDLSAARDNIALSFDLKSNPTMLINISGLITSTTKNRLLPNSVSFDSSNYLGSLSYQISLYIFSGTTGETSLINKVHTVTTNTDENGCQTKSVNISCQPNSSENYEGCNAISGASAWISGRMDTHKQNPTIDAYPELQNESISIDPLNGSVSYSANYGDCSSEQGQGQNVDKNVANSNMAICESETIDNTSCPTASQIVTKKVNVKIYEKDGTQEDLTAKLAGVANQYAGKIQDFSSDYNSSNNEIGGSFTVRTDGDGNAVNDPSDLLLAVYSKTTNIKYLYTEAGELKETPQGGSIAGQVLLLNPNKKTKSLVVSYDTSTLQSLAKSAAGAGAKITNESIVTDEIAQTKSFNFSYEQSKTDAEHPNLEDYSGISSYSISYTPSLQAFELIPNINCDPLIFNKGFVNRGNTTITIQAISGSGYDFEQNAKDLKNELKNMVITNQSEIEEETKEEKAIDNRGMTLTYTANFKGSSAINPETPSTITSLY